MEKKVVSQKVYLLNTTEAGTVKSVDKSGWTIVEVIPWTPDLGDYCGHVVVVNKKGERREVREWEAICVKPCMGDELRNISEYLSDNGINGYVSEDLRLFAVIVDIDWGDWKHDHLYVRDLMDYIGYHEVGSKVYEEDGSDCYSARHYFVKESALA